MPRDLRQLLEETAVTPSVRLGPAALMERGRRRRARRRATLGAALALAALISVVNLLPAQPRPAEVILQPRPTGPEPAVTEPDPATSEPHPGASEAGATASEAARDTQSLGPPLNLNELPELPAHGVAVQVDDDVVLLGLNGKAHGFLPGTIDHSAFYGFDPVQQGPTNLLRLRVGQRDAVWLDPHTRTFVRTTEVAAPMRSGEVIYEPHAPGGGEMLLRHGDRTVIARWPAASRWVVSPDHRLVTWWPCEDQRCAPRFFDFDGMERPAELERGCWAATAVGDFDYQLICNGGRAIQHGLATEPARSAIPRGSDGQPASATAVYGAGIVRVDHASCGVVEPFRLTERGLAPLLAGPRAAVPSAVPLGQLPDGRVVLHYNGDAACDGQSRDPGIVLYDPDTSTETRVWSGRAPAGTAQMWGGTHTNLSS